MGTIAKIKTIEQLVGVLESGAGYDGFTGIMNSIDFGEEELGRYCSWDEKEHTRNLIAKTDSFELMVMCWKPGQITTIHDYNLREGWVYVIKGELTEERFHYSKALGGIECVFKEKIPEGSFSYMNDYIGMHRYSNTNDESSISLHLYSEPLTKWKVYDEETGSFREESVSYHSRP